MSRAADVGSATGERASMANADRILVRGVNWLGDAIMSTPALRRLREAHPEAEITLLGPAKLAPLWEHHSAVDAVWSFDPDESMRQIARRIRQGKFELGIVFPNSPRSALELWRGNVPRRIGYTARWRNWWLTEAVPRRPGIIRMRKRSRREIRRLIAASEPPESPVHPPEAHHIFHYLHLVAETGADPKPLPPEIQVTGGEVEEVCRRYEIPGRNETDTPLFGLNPGAEYGPAKRWPADRFVAAAQELHRRTGCRWLVFGGGNDRSLAEEISERIQSGLNTTKSGGDGSGPVRVWNLAGRTTLRELCVLLKRCRVLLTNDTGPMHVGAAVGTPVVVPFGSTSPALTGPGLPGESRHAVLQAGVPCAPCYLRRCPIDFRCMHRITVAQVVQAVWDAAVV